MLERISIWPLFPLGIKHLRCWRTRSSPNNILYKGVSRLIRASFSRITKSLSSTWHYCRDCRIKLLIFDSFLWRCRHHYGLENSNIFQFYLKWQDLYYERGLNQSFEKWRASISIYKTKYNACFLKFCFTIPCIYFKYYIILYDEALNGQF